MAPVTIAWAWCVAAAAGAAVCPFLLLDARRLGEPARAASGGGLALVMGRCQPICFTVRHGPYRTCDKNP